MELGFWKSGESEREPRLQAKAEENNWKRERMKQSPALTGQSPEKTKINGGNGAVSRFGERRQDDKSEYKRNFRQKRKTGKNSLRATLASRLANERRARCVG